MERIRVDALGAIVTSLEVIVVLGTLKVLALKYHGHPLAQAYLVLI